MFAVACVLLPIHSCLMKRIQCSLSTGVLGETDIACVTFLPINLYCLPLRCTVSRKRSTIS